MGVSAFTFAGVTLPGGEDPLGVWTLGEVHEAVTAFAASGADKALVWRVVLPAAGREATAQLAAQIATVAVRQDDLAIAEARLAALHPGVVSFSAGPLAGPEAALLAAVARLAEPSVAFGTDAEAASDIRGIYGECQELLAQFRRLLEHYAWIETTLDGLDVALTVVAWSGDHETIWLEGATAAQMQTHRDAVRLAMVSRDALVRLINVVASGAVALALKASVPGGQILLLPAVYQYVRDVLKALEQFRSEGDKDGRE